MRFTDACIHPYPDGDSSLRRMSIECRELGYDSAVALADRIPQDIPIEILKGHLLQGDTMKALVASARRVPQGCLLMVEAGDYALNRAIVRMKGIQIVRGAWRVSPNAIDHIVARFAAERGIAFDIELAPLVKLRGISRQKVLQRYRELLMYSRRTGCRLTISTGARSILEQRGVREATLLCSLFGMTRSEVLDALAAPGEMLRERDDVRVVEGT